MPFRHSCLLSGKQDSNLQPPASKAGKQPIVIFPVLFSVLSGIEPCSAEPQPAVLPFKLKAPSAAYTRIELVAPERQSGRLPLPQ